MKLTPKFLDHANPPENHNFVDYKDDKTQGLYFRVLAGGSKRWVMLYRINGRRRNPVIANFPETRLSEARDLATDWWSQIKKGIDPKAVEDQNRAARLEMPSVSDFADTYIERYAKHYKKSWPEDRRILDRYVLPSIGPIPMNEVKRRDIVRALDVIRDQGKHVQANRALAVIGKMFNFAIERDEIDASPVSGIRAMKEQPRDRIFTDAEIRRFWEGTGPESSMNPATRLALRLLMLTGQRSGEVCGLRRSEIDLEKRLWALPAERTKNKMKHTVPLSPQAVEVIEEAMASSWSDEYVFPAARGYGHLAASGLSQVIKRVFESEDRPTVHDIRRTVGTRLSESNSRLIVDKVLNHADRSVGGIYDRYTYDKEKRTALEGWARRLDRIVTGDNESNVVEMNQ